MENLRIIVIEDERRILQLIVSKIQHTVPNCEVIATANNGEEGLRLAEQYRPDIVFSDIKMPVMSGLELAKKLRERFAHMYVVLLSGYSDFAFAKEAMRYDVSYYLLKPLDEEELLEVTEDIRMKIEERRCQKDPYVFLSGQNGSHLIFQQEKEDYLHYVLTFCFYNLYCAGANELLMEYYEQNLNKIDWEKVMQTVQPYCVEWMVADGTPCNLKNIVLTVPKDAEEKVDLMAECLCEFFHVHYPNYGFHLCYHQEPVKREELWSDTVRIKRVLENKVVPAREQIFILEEAEELVDTMELYEAVRLRLQNNVKVLFKTQNYQMLSKELNDIISFTLDNKCTQKQFLKILNNILKLIEENKEICQEVWETISAEKEKLYAAISLANQPEEIAEAFSSLFVAYFQDELDTKESQKCKEEILAYVEQNYMVIDSVEQVAEKFNYNYTYISRMFRNAKGISMVKYITNKRIEEAKRIMEEDPKLSISSVCNMVGYMDQHYFSRVFKSVTGMSPKEYKTICSGKSSEAAESGSEE